MKVTIISRAFGLVASMLLLSGCGRPQGLDTVEVGQDVALTRADGGVVEGKVASLDDKSVRVTSGPTTKSIPKGEILDVKVIDETKPTVLPAAAKFREFTVPEGSALSVKLETAINSATSRIEDKVEATLVKAVTLGNADVLPVGSSLTGFVSAVQGSAKVKGLASITVQFTSITPAGRDEHYDISAAYAETADSTKRADATKIGVGAGAGAVIGGILGGKSGAAAGAAVGGGAGTAVVLSTKGQDVERPAGALLTVMLKAPVDVRVPIR